MVHPTSDAAQSWIGAVKEDGFHPFFQMLIGPDSHLRGNRANDFDAPERPALLKDMVHAFSE